MAKALNNKNIKTPYWKKVLNLLSPIGGVLVIIWTILQIYNALVTSGNYKLAVKGGYYDFELPVTVVNIIKSYSNEIINEGITDNLDVTEGTNSAARLQNVDEISKLSELSSFWSFQINNPGNKEVKDINLEAPFEGYYALEGPTAAKSGYFQNNIELGSLRPSNTITVKLWSTNIRSKSLGIEVKILKKTDGIKITYPEGVTKIQYPMTISGPSTFLYK